jgi:hypothetical protein
MKKTLKDPGDLVFIVPDNVKVRVEEIRAEAAAVYSDSVASQNVLIQELLITELAKLTELASRLFEEGP